MYWKLYRIFGFIVAPMGAFPIAGKSENAAIFDAAFDTMSRTLEEGGIVCIFPEGMLTLDGEMNRFRLGIMKVLERNPVPIIPVALCGLWGSYFSKKKPGVFKLPDHFMAEITMLVGPPLPPDTKVQGIQAAVAALMETKDV